MVHIGDHVVYCDEYGVEHQALVTQVWDGGLPPDAKPGVNLVVVVGDESQRDQYGQQIDRPTSVVHKSVQAAQGRYWREP